MEYLAVLSVTLLCLFPANLGDYIFETEDGRNYLRDDEFVKDQDHIREELEGRVSFDPKKISQEELEFHFFQLHDYNDDRKLDGLEFLKAMQHVLEHNMAKRTDLPPIGSEEYSKRLEKYLSRMSKIIDTIFEDDDANKDGYLGYEEFKNARKAKILAQASQSLSKKDKKD